MLLLPRLFQANLFSGLRTGTTAAAHYDLRGERAMPSDGPDAIVNMGYWAAADGIRPSTQHAANMALFELVLDVSDIEPGHRVLDAGCGFGTATALAARRSGARTVGLNVSAVQLDVAGRSHPEDNIEFVLGSATSMPFPAGSFDRILSVEAAFHFKTRDRFFQEAHRVLSPNGCIAIADLVLTPPRNAFQRAALSVLSHQLPFPEENVYDLDAYRARLESAGFEIESCRSIGHEVIPFFRKWMGRNLLRHRELLRDFGAWPYLVYPWDYALIVARKC